MVMQTTFNGYYTCYNYYTITLCTATGYTNYMYGYIGWTTNIKAATHISQ